MPLTTVSPGMLDTTAQYYGFKNRIINGAMVIDQRNNGASGTAIAYTVDRFGYYATQASKGTWQQNAGSVTPPTGFKNYLGFTSSSAYSVLSTDQFILYQNIEGLNVADLAWGTASAATVTLSFWVRSSLTGTFGGSLQNGAFDRSYPFSYTISAANTWEQKTVTIAGDTTGTWLTTNGIGVAVNFSLGMGSSKATTAGAWAAGNFQSATGATSVVGTNGATFYITGVQLEKGSTATSFDYRPYGTELALCQRYFEFITGPIYATYTNVASTNTRGTYIYYKTTKRTAPGITFVGTSEYIPSGGTGNNFSPTAQGITTEGFSPWGGNVASGVFVLCYTGTGAGIQASAEL